MKDTAIHKPFITGKTTLPILNKAMAKDGKLYTTNLDVYMQTDTDLEDGIYQLVGKDWIKEDIPLDEFPSIPSANGGSVTLMMDRIAIKRLLAIQSTDETRYILNSILLRVTKDKITAVSTDGRRITICEWKTKTTKAVEGDYIVGGDKRHPFALLLKDKKRDAITITFPKVNKGTHYITMSNGEQTIIARCVDGTYPKYKEVIPKTAEGRFYFSLKHMTDALKELRPYAPPKSNRYGLPATVKLELKDDTLELSVEDIDRSLKKTCVVDVKQVSRTESLKIALSIDFLADSMIQPDGLVYAEYVDELSPMVFGIQSEGKWSIDKTIQMPIRKN